MTMVGYNRSVFMSARSQAIRDFLEKCIQNRRKDLLKKLEGKTDAGSRKKRREILDKIVLPVILSEGAEVASQIQIATHVAKATHPNIHIKNTTNLLYTSPNDFTQHKEVGTHSLSAPNLVADATGDGAKNKKAYEAYLLLQRKFEEKTILQMLKEKDRDAINALDNDKNRADELADKLIEIDSPKITSPASHSLMKQVYWLVGRDATNNEEYHLLSPLFSNPLVHAMHAEITDARFGEANVAARRSRWNKNEKPQEGAAYRDYPNLIARKLGGKKQLNISQLNSERSGINYLLASLPPHWQEQPKSFLNISSALDHFRNYNNVDQHVKKLCQFLMANPKSTMKPYAKRERIEQALYQLFVEFGFEIQEQYTPGWTRNADCKLQRCERLWLDPGRAYLPPHPDHKEDDQAFTREFGQKVWPDSVATLFAKWLYSILYKAGLPVGDNEIQRWKKQARHVIVCATDWPATARYRAHIPGKVSEEPHS
ncbi:MAG: type I-F CRISPR-associated protein Csy1 [Azoarcus sp.]|jgi:CRISPR-associated protein Csy1|nr:type I-F CRISPR-associated protein Csy1 [Azoarcus sp.]